MEGVTLIESGTSRAHFALIKRVEGAKTAQLADQFILASLTDVQDAFSSKHSHSYTPASLASHLLVLLHCIELFPTSPDSALALPSIQFALIPSLHLAATATRARHLLLAYNILGHVFAAQSDEEQHQTSLLVLNTIRQHLEPGKDKAKAKAKRGQRAKQSAQTDPLSLSKVTFALQSISIGVPAGPDIFPALYGPVSQLCHHPDEGIQRLALDALGKIKSYADQDDGVARAVWERARGVLSSFSKNKRGVGASEALPRALLRALKRAMEDKVVADEAACEAGMALFALQSSPALALSCLELCGEIVLRGACGATTVERVQLATVDVCQTYPSSFSTLLSAARLLGKLSFLNAAMEPSRVQSVWALIRTHLNAKNANRKLMALSTLQAFLPFSWPAAGNAAGIELDEVEMGKLMAMLSDSDESVRMQALHLLHSIDSNLLVSHYQQLLDASQDEGRSVPERKEVLRRAVEVAGERIRAGDSLPYADAIDAILASAMDNSVDDDIIRLVLGHLRRAAPPLAFQASAHLLSKREGVERATPTRVLLTASLACELDCDDAMSETSLVQMASVLPNVVERAALLEALLIGMMKVASQTQEIPTVVSATVDKVCEGIGSSMVQHRFRQLQSILSDSSRTATRLPSGTLLETMDRVERHLVAPNASSSHATPTHTSYSRLPRPLQYEAYPQSPPSPPSPSPKKQQPFAALPRPSAAQDDRMRLQRKRREEGIQEEMQKSIARLTLGKDTYEEGETNEDSKDADGDGDEDASEAALF